LAAQRETSSEVLLLQSEVAGLRSVVAGQGRQLEEQQRQMAVLLSGAAWQNSALAQLLAGQQHLANSGGGGQRCEELAVGDGRAAGCEALSLSDAHAGAYAPAFPVAPPPAAALPPVETLPVPHLTSSTATASGKGKAPAPRNTLTDVLAKVHFGERMASGGSVSLLLPAQHRTLSNQIYQWFGRMATQAEKQLLFPPLISQSADMHEVQGQRRLLLTKLHGLVVARLRDQFPSSIDIPLGLREGKVKSLVCSSISEYTKKLKKNKVPVDLSAEAFQNFRREFEAGTSSNPGPSSSSSSSSSAGGASVAAEPRKRPKV